MLDLSIIIVNWNGRELLRKCLDAVQATTKTTQYEIVVVDNNSSDGSQDMVRQDYPGVKLIANSENVGFARANNQALEINTARYALLLNSDAFVKENTIDTMVEFMDSHPDAGMAGCKLLYEDGRLQPSCTTFPTLFSEFCIATGLDKAFAKSPIFGRYQMTFWDFNDIREVDAIMGAFMLVRAEPLAEIGYLDPAYFMYSEEVDWCYRFKKAGWKIYYYPHVEAVHLWGGSSKKVKVEMHIQLYRSRIEFFRKNYGSLPAFFVKLIIGLNCLVRLGPGILYYFKKADSQGKQKYQASWQLLHALPNL